MTDKRIREQMDVLLMLRKVCDLTHKQKCPDIPYEYSGSICDTCPLHLKYRIEGFGCISLLLSTVIIRDENVVNRLRQYERENDND